MKLNGAAMNWVEEFRYLGVHLTRNLSEKVEVDRKRADLFGRTNSLMGNFASMPRSVRQKVFLAKCAHLYGCQAWNLLDKNVLRAKTAYNRCLRRILGLPNRTHSVYLPLISQTVPFECNLFSKVKGFMKE